MPNCGSVAQSCPTLCGPMDCSTPGFSVHHHLPEFAQTHVHWVGDVIQPFYPLSSPSPPAFNLSQPRGLSSESALCIKWPKYWHFTFSISPSNEYSGLISFRMDWLDLLAVQGTLKSLLHHHSSKASFLWCSAFLIVQLSHPYMTTGKTTALTIWTFVSKVMSQENKICQSVQSLSPIWLFVSPVDCSTPGFPVHQQPRASSNSYPSSRWCHSFRMPNSISKLPFPKTRLLVFPHNFSFQSSQFRSHEMKQWQLHLSCCSGRNLESFCFAPCNQSDSKSFKTATSHHLHSHQNPSYSLTKLLLLLCPSPPFNTLSAQLPVSQEHLHEAQHLCMASHCSHN